MSTPSKRAPKLCRNCKAQLPKDMQYGPFCSERCKMNDLSNWFSQNYGIEAIEDDGTEIDGNFDAISLDEERDT
jgi:endogenous inhibitor of DNA gyrase (YacG/DUF329 family)